MGRGTYPRCDSSQSRHARVRHRRKSSGPEHNSHCALRRRRSFRACRREFTKDGLQERPLHGRRLQSLESGWLTDYELDTLIAMSPVRVHRILGCFAVLHSVLLLIPFFYLDTMNGWPMRLWFGLCTLWLFWPLILALHPAQSARRVLIPLGFAAPFAFLWFRFYAGMAAPLFGLPDGLELYPHTIAQWAVSYGRGWVD